MRGRPYAGAALGKETPARGTAPGLRSVRPRMGGIRSPSSAEQQAELKVPDFMIACHRAADAYRCRPLRPASNYLCSLGTNTVLGNVTNGLFVLLLGDGAEN